MWKWHKGTQFNDKTHEVRLMVGLNDLEDLFQSR